MATTMDKITTMDELLQAVASQCVRTTPVFNFMYKQSN